MPIQPSVDLTPYNSASIIDNQAIEHQAIEHRGRSKSHQCADNVNPLTNVRGFTIVKVALRGFPIQEFRRFSVLTTMILALSMLETSADATGPLVKPNS